MQQYTLTFFLRIYLLFTSVSYCKLRFAGYERLVKILMIISLSQTQAVHRQVKSRQVNVYSRAVSGLKRARVGGFFKKCRVYTLVCNVHKPDNLKAYTYNQKQKHAIIHATIFP